MRFFACCVLILSLQLLARAQVSDSYEATASKIERGDHGAILSAGSSTDVRFIPLLKRTLRRYSKDDRSVAEDVRLALAKLGDQGELEAVLCELHSDDPYIQSHALKDKLRYIGGWAAIDTLLTFLPDTPDNQKGVAQGDMAFGSRTHVAIAILGELLPTGPRSKGSRRSAIFSEGDAEEAADWRAWIEKNKEELMKLRPVGHYHPANCYGTTPKNPSLKR
jgi:hypothetical protein